MLKSINVLNGFELKKLYDKNCNFKKELDEDCRQVLIYTFEEIFEEIRQDCGYLISVDFNEWDINKIDIPDIETDFDKHEFMTAVVRYSCEWYESAITLFSDSYVELLKDVLYCNDNKLKETAWTGFKTKIMYGIMSEWNTMKDNPFAYNDSFAERHSDIMTDGENVYRKF